MIAVLLITVLFVCLSVYFFFRAEKLQHTIISLKRDTSKMQSENQAFSKAMGLVAGNTEEFYKARLQLLMQTIKDEKMLDELAIIQLLINNYALIFKGCLLKKGKLHSLTKNCLTTKEESSYQTFLEKIVKKDSKIQRVWNSNNFIGFTSMMEALLVRYEKLVLDGAATEDSSTA